MTDEENDDDQQESYSDDEHSVISRKNPITLIAVGITMLIAGAVLGTLVFKNHYDNNDVISFGLPSMILNILGLAFIASTFFVIIKEYERGIVLRLGSYSRTIVKGIQFRIPFVDSIYVVDTREKVRTFFEENMLTKDNVPVGIDSLLRYKINTDESVTTNDDKTGKEKTKTGTAKDTILKLENFESMITQVSQAVLRTNIGASDLQAVISERETVNEKIQKALEKETKDWGIVITGVEIRNVVIPKQLESAMSAKAQAEREKDARVIYAESEILVAKKFVEASKEYANNPTAYALRQSNLLYESMKAKGNTTILVPSESLNQMGYGNLALVESYLKNLQSKEKEKQDKK